MDRTIEVCNAAVVRINERQTGTIHTAQRVWTITAKPEQITARKVWVLPAGYGMPELATRGQDTDDYSIGIIVAERYTDAGTPPDEWIQERVEWLRKQIWDVLQDPRDVAILDQMWPHIGEVSLYDYDFLRQHKLYWGEVALTFREFA